MAGVVQLVRASDCGSGCRRFESGHSPHFEEVCMDIVRYEDMVQGALLSVLRDVLLDVVANGLSEGKRLYLGFRSDFRSVRIPDFLREKYPREMMIALEDGVYRDLIVSDECVVVTLSFNGVGEDLLIPFTAFFAFADPEERFALQFEPYDEEVDPSDDEKIVTFENLKNR